MDEAMLQHAVLFPCRFFNNYSLRGRFYFLLVLAQTQKALYIFPQFFLHTQENVFLSETSNIVSSLAPTLFHLSIILEIGGNWYQAPHLADAALDNYLC